MLSIELHTLNRVQRSFRAKVCYYCTKLYRLNMHRPTKYQHLISTEVINLCQTP